MTYPELTGRPYKHRSGSNIHKVLAFTLDIAQLPRIKPADWMRLQKKKRKPSEFRLWVSTYRQTDMMAWKTIQINCTNISVTTNCKLCNVKCATKRWQVEQNCLKKKMVSATMLEKRNPWVERQIMDNTCDWLCSIPHSHGKYLRNNCAADPKRQ